MQHTVATELSISMAKLSEASNSRFILYYSSAIENIKQKYEMSKSIVTFPHLSSGLWHSNSTTKEKAKRLKSVGSGLQIYSCLIEQRRKRNESCAELISDLFSEVCF